MKRLLLSILFLTLFLELSFAREYKFTDADDYPQITNETDWRRAVDKLNSGDEVIFNGKKFKLGKEVSNIGVSARVYHLHDDPAKILKIIKNPFGTLEVLSLDKEEKNLKILKNAGVDVPEVYEKSKNGNYLVKEFVAGETAEVVFKRMNQMNFHEKNQFYKSLATTFNTLELQDVFPSDLNYHNVVYTPNKKAYIIDPGLLTDEALYLNPIKMGMQDFSRDSFIYKMQEAYLNKKIALPEAELTKLLEKYYNNFDNVVNLFYGVNVPELEKELTKSIQEVFFKKSGQFSKTDLYANAFSSGKLEKLEQDFFNKIFREVKSADEFTHYLKTIKELKRDKHLKLVLIDNSHYFTALNPSQEQIELFHSLSGSYPVKARSCIRGIALGVLNK